MKKINIVFGSSTFITMKKSNILNNNIIEFDTIFSVADLSNLDNYELILPKEIYNNNIYSFVKEINKLNKLIDNNKEIRIWTSHFEINSYLLFLYLCNYLKDENCNLYVVFSDEYNKDCYSPSCMNKNELEELINFEHKLSKQEILNLLKELGEVKIVTLVGLFMSNHIIQDLIICYFINRLINDKKIKITKYGNRFFENIITIN